LDAWYDHTAQLYRGSWADSLQIWDLFEGKHLFHGIDDKIPAESNPNDGGYTTRAHLAEVVGLLGLPPADLLSRGSRSKEFFTRDGISLT